VPLAHAVPILLLAFGEDTTPIRVSYDAPATCPAEAAFYDAIAMRTDHVRRAVDDEVAIEVNVRVTRNERGFRGEVRETVNRTESSARSVDGATCKEVVEALSLTIALSVDPNAHAPVAKPPEPAPAAPVCPPVPEPHVAPPPAAPPTAAVELGLRALTTQVLTSHFDAGVALSGAVLRKTGERFGASLELSLLFAATGVLGTPADHESQFAGLALDACPARFQFGRLELGPCALAVVGVLEAGGRGVAQPATVEHGWSSGGADFQLSALLGDGFVLEGALGATVPLVKRRFYLSLPGNVITETPLISPLLRLGLGFRF
jgi:hypothetical protein